MEKYWFLVDARRPNRCFFRCGQSYIASVIGCRRDTVARGIAELATLPDEATENRTRRPGGGRKKETVSAPDLVDNFFSRRASHCR